MSTIKIFIDTDIVLDFFLNRQPHLEYARKVFQLARNEKIELYTSVTTFTNSYYILTKLISNSEAKEKLVFLEKWVQVLQSEQAIIKQALFSKFSDFEDAIQHFTAVACKIDILLTRNIKDYKNAIILVQTPREFLNS